MNIFLLELQTNEKPVYIGLAKDLVKAVNKVDSSVPFETKLILAFSPKRANKRYTQLIDSLQEYNIKGTWFRKEVLLTPPIRQQFYNQGTTNGKEKE